MEKTVSNVSSEIEKIKLQQQDNEARLKEMREFDAAVISINRAIRNSLAHVEKSKQECGELMSSIDKLQSEVTVEKEGRNALLHLMDQCRAEMADLRRKSDEGVSAVWTGRSTLLEAVQKVSDTCDVWALFTRPAYSEAVSTEKHLNMTVNTSNEDRLKEAIVRRNRAAAERDRLLNEPDVGDEYIRNYIHTYRQRRLYSARIEANENAPIKFTTSMAASKTVAPIMKKSDVNMPWYQPYSVVGSVAAFLIYFCALREENDLDLEFNKTLYDRIKGLEKEQLLQSYRFNKEHGKSVDDIQKRLEEIEEEEKRSLDV